MSNTIVRVRNGAIRDKDSSPAPGLFQRNSEKDAIADDYKNESGIGTRISRKNEGQRRSKVAAYVLLFIFIFWCCSTRQLGPRSIRSASVPNKSAKSHKTFIAAWIEHITSHPIQPSDRYGFSEMGLRARVYARLLEKQYLTDADDIESSLWPFAPGAKRMRLAHFGSNSSKQNASIRPPSSNKGVHAGTFQEKEHLNTNFRSGLETSHISMPSIQGRGIVMSLGSSQFRFAMHFLSILRDVHKSKLAVEIYYYGDDDLPESLRHLLESSYADVHTIDLKETNFFDPSFAKLSRQGWALKPFALLATNFSEVILADADVVLLTDPAEFFELKGYKNTGTLFFHDRDHYREGASKIIHRFLNDQLGKRGPSRRLSQSSFWLKKGIYEQESGVVVIDKRYKGVFSALFLAAWQNTGAVRERTTYRVFWGDKESYWLAFELAGIPYYFVEHYAGGLGNDPWEGQFCSDHPLHFIPDESEEAQPISGQSMEHRKKRPGRAAWFNGSLLENKGRNDDVYLSQTAWSVGNSWTFFEDVERWCLSNGSYFGDSLEELGKGTILAKLIDTAQRADRELQKLES